MLTVVTVLAAAQLWDGHLSRLDAIVLLGVLAAVVGWSILQGLRERSDTLGVEMEQELAAHAMPLPRALVWLVVGLVLLIVSSRILVWGGGEHCAGAWGQRPRHRADHRRHRDSLPELASSLIAVRKGEPDLALGNVIDRVEGLVLLTVFLGYTGYLVSTVFATA